jgi:murein DD-endopeptidase MepM/ murein hydrolase activator NlpD
VCGISLAFYLSVPRILTLALACSALLFIGQAEGRTPPRRGAAHKPRQFKIQQPFPCGTKIRISCGYGPKCSPAHKRLFSQTATNDYYALDLSRVEPNNGFNKSVVSVASGVVRYAGWTKRGWAPYGKIVYIEHDFVDGKGKTYQSIYAHLNSVKVKVGQQVEAGTVIGTLGGSSKHRLNKFGPHLHFAMYRGARSTLGGGEAVVPEPFGEDEDLHARMSMVACQAPQPELLATAPTETEQDEAFGGLEP